MQIQYTAIETQTQAFVSIRRAFRLRRFKDALAPARRLVGPEDWTRWQIMAAAEQAGVSHAYAESLWQWMALNLYPGRAEDLTLAWLESARAFSLGTPKQQAAVVKQAESEPDIVASDTPPPEHPATTIEIRAGELTRMVNEAEAALIAFGAGIYQQGGGLVRVGWTDGEDIKALPVDETHLLELMGRAAVWIRFDARSKKNVPATCPREVARAYLARGGLEWRVPRLTGIIHAPTLRADGSVLDVPGHDAATGLFLNVTGAELPWIEARPSYDDAGEAAEALDALLTEFAFVAEQDRAVAIAAILTAVVRSSLPTAPLFAFTAPTPGTGKSYLIDLVSMIATGRAAQVFTWTGDPAEDRKQLDSALLEGRGTINLDNVRVALGGDRLNQMLTQAAVSIRPLGHSTVTEVPCAVFVTANGNNLAIEADLTRRTMLCRMDCGLARPEDRPFAGKPLAAVERDRNRYVGAVLTILRAYVVAGRPGQPSALGSFDDWSGLVRGAMAWLGYPDPVASMNAVREVDPRGAELAAVVGQWDASIGDRHTTSAGIIAAAVDAPEFREALLAVAGIAGSINTRRLGMWLHGNRDRVVGGVTIRAAGKDRNKVALWALEGARRVVDVLEYPRLA